MIVHIHLAKLAAALALIGAIGAGLHFVCGAEDAPAPASALPAAPPGQLSFGADAPQLSLLKVAAVAAVPLPLSEPLNGRLAYDENRTARVSSPVAGRVMAAVPEPGERVARGAVLAVIDAPELATAQADWRQAEAGEALKRQAAARAAALFEAGLLAQKDHEAAQADWRQAQAESRRSQLRLRSLNATGREDGSFSLRAPVAGVLADKQTNPGLEVRPDLPNPLFVVTDPRRLWLLVDVPERSAAALHPGQRASFDTDAYPGQRFGAKVEHVALALDPVTRRVRVRCAVDNPDLKLRPEMFARVAFLAGDGAKQALPVPNGSLFVDGVREVVFVETRPGTFARRHVNVALRGRDTSYIDAGLRAGERVVTEGAFLLNAEVAAHAQ